MSIFQLDIYGKTKVETAIERFKRFEPKDGYFLAFSGGKDSVVIKALADMAGVKYDAHYAITSVDPPALVQFVKEKHPDVIRENQKWKKAGLYHREGAPITMWNLIPQKNMPPTRIVRYCCAFLKETSGEGRFVVTGVRWAESAKRAQNRGGLELAEKKSHRVTKYDPDTTNGGLIHTTQKFARRGLNPIVDWTNEEVWEFIKEFNIPYCELYNEGFERLGCIGCPIAQNGARIRELKRYPKFNEAYLRAFDRMLKERWKKELESEWNSAEEVMEWWLEKNNANL